MADRALPAATPPSTRPRNDRRFSRFLSDIRPSNCEWFATNPLSPNEKYHRSGEGGRAAETTRAAAVAAAPFGFRRCGVRQAAFSMAASHLPSEAMPFIRARWWKAFCAAATFSALPDQAFCGAACRARP